MKLIYISYNGLSPKKEKDFFMSDLEKIGVVIEYWDVRKLFFRQENDELEYRKNYIKFISSYQEFDAEIGKIDNAEALYNLIITFDFLSLKLYRILTRNKCTLFFFERAGLPPIRSSSTFSIMLKKLLNINSLLKFIRERWARFLKIIGYIKEYDIVFKAGNAKYNIKNKKTRVIPIHYFDYDEYITVLTQGHTESVEKEHIVFLDENQPFHPDFIKLGMKMVDPNEYFNSVNNFFEVLEKKFKKKVVIAAHPSSQYSGEEFNGRKVYRNMTKDLVKECSFVIAHMSTSISYAVLFNKPIIFIYTNEFKKIYQNSIFMILKGMASSLNKIPYNINTLNELSDEDVNVLLNLDKDAYERYKQNYLYSIQTANKLSREIFIDFIKTKAAVI